MTHYRFRTVITLKHVQWRWNSDLSGNLATGVRRNIAVNRHSDEWACYPPSPRRLPPRS
jgi:hypothetical protein